MTKTISPRRVAHNGSKGHSDLKNLVTQARHTVSDTGSHATVDLQALRDRLRRRG